MKQNYTSGVGVVEFTVVFDSGARILKRVLFLEVKGFDSTGERELSYFDAYTREYLAELMNTHSLVIDFT